MLLTRPKPTMEEITALAKRRGFIFPSSEIYGGVNGIWDYGPVGVELKRNVREAWWRDMVTLRDDVVGIETSLIMHPEVWRASGHVENFTDMMVDCKTCKKRYRADQQPAIERNGQRIDALAGSVDWLVASLELADQQSAIERE